MREVFSDFMRLERRPDGSVRIRLGAEGSAADLTGLVAGERVRVIYPGELVAQATIAREVHDGRTFLYALLPSVEAIHDIHPDTLAEQRRTGTSAWA